MTVRARNVESNIVLADRVTIAATRRERAVGLLRHDSLASGHGLLISPCRGVHTCGMRFAIDLVALDRDGTVVDLVDDMAPWRIRLPRRGTASVLELPAGSLSWSRTRVGHRIALEVIP